MHQEEQRTVIFRRKTSLKSPARSIVGFYLLLHVLILAPVHAERRISQHKIELLVFELVICKCISLAYLLIFVLQISLDKQVGLADGICLLVKFLAVQVNLDVVAPGHFLHHLLRYCKHSTGTAARVVNGKHLSELLQLLFLPIEC